MPAANKVEVQRHDLESIWDVTHKHGEEIGELKEITGRLEVGQLGMREQMGREFQTLRETISTNAQHNRRAPPNVIGIATLLVLVLGACGAVMTYFNTQITNSIQRENDLRFEFIAQRESDMAEGFIHQTGQQAAINKDVYEQLANSQKYDLENEFDKGYAKAKFEKLDQKFEQLYAESNVRKDQIEHLILEIYQRISAVESSK